MAKKKITRMCAFAAHKVRNKSAPEIGVVRQRQAKSSKTPPPVQVRCVGHVPHPTAKSPQDFKVKGPKFNNIPKKGVVRSDGINKNRYAEWRPWDE